MSAIDVDQLLREVSADSPCGPDLEYDGAFTTMTRAAAGKPAQEIGGQVLPGEEPDWRTVRDQCATLLGRSKDLRIAVFLTRALLHTDALPGFASGLALVQGLLERYWVGVHPALDPDDDNDPTFRVNTLAGLADRELTLTALRMVPLANSRRVGRFGLRDVEIANGTLPRPEGVEGLPDNAAVDAAFLDMDVAELQATAEAAGAALERTEAVDRLLTDQVGAGSSADFGPLRNTLKSMNVLLRHQLGRRGLASGEGAVAEGAAGGAAPAAAGGTPMTGSIQGREDIIRVLDQVCDWYARNEPSSPVPLLLVRAKRLVSKNFVELIQDLSPGGLTEIQTIAGLDNH